MTSDTGTLEAEIRFQLDQVGARNAQLDFETLCRRHARARVCDRLLPATGPVADGGDQGRDFESFQSFKEENTGSSVFAGSSMSGDKRVVFACTTQRTGVTSKIKGDVKAIMSGSERPDHVVFYSVSDLPVSRRHKVQEWARDTFQVSLDVFDGQALSEELARPELFWIAVEHLRIAATKAPQQPLEEEWYRATRDEWAGEPAPDVPPTTAEYLKLRQAARHFLSDPSSKKDLPIWLGALRAFGAAAGDGALSLEARYERLVLTIRGTQTLEGSEDEVIAFLADALKIHEATSFENASIILTYVYGATARGAVNIAEEHFFEWHGKLDQAATDLMDRVASKLDRARLLEVRASLALLVRGEEQRDDSARAAISFWHEITQIAKSEPLFPVDTLAERLTLMTPMFVAVSGFRELIERVDELVATRAGDAAAGSRARDRAMVLYEQELYVECIHELHKAKRLWFAAETQRGAILAMQLLAMSYSALRCHQASKYYGLAAAALAGRDEKAANSDLIPRGIAAAAVADFNSGAWLNFLALANLALLAHLHYETDRGDVEKHEHLKWVLGCAAHVVAWGKTHAPQLAEHALRTLGSNPAADLVRSVADDLETTSGQLKITDCGDLRTLEWAAFGVTWAVHFKNEGDTTAIAEMLMATLQITLVEFADQDLEVLPTSVAVDVQVSATEPSGLSYGNEESRWQFVGRPVDTQTSADLGRACAAAVVRMVGDVGLSPDYEPWLAAKLKAGLPEKALSVRSHAHLYLEVVGEDTFKETVDAFRDASLASASHVDADAPLGAREGVSPRYDAAKANEMLKRRYDAGTRSSAKTLPRLCREMHFRETVTLLRSEGWLGWQICAAVSAITSAEVLERAYGPQWALNRSAQQVYLKLTYETEVADPDISASAYTVERLRMQMQMNMVNSLSRYGLKLRERRLDDFDAVQAFLGTRFRFFTDDLPELDPLRAFGV